MSQMTVAEARKPAQSAPASANGVLQRKCDKCRKKKPLLQRAAAGPYPETVPPIVHEVLRSPGQPLDAATRAFMEPRFGHDFSKISVHFRSQASIKAKLKVNIPGDIYEKEADRVANRVLATPAHQAVSCAPLHIQRYARQAIEGANIAPSSVDQALASSGRPLEPTLRHDMEQRFGHDFSEVRLHLGAAAEQSAKHINANAYTVGNNIVFGAAQFAPGTHEGRRLLAHELAHVIQQSNGRGIGLIQRAEVDDRSCSGLQDIAPDIDAEVNSAIAAAKAASSTPFVVMDFLKDVAGRVGGKFVGSIEKFIQGMPTSKRTDPAKDLTGTKFAGVENVNRFYKLHTAGLAKVVGPAANVKGICTGADKFGHFFEEGFLYFQIAKAVGTAATLDSLGNFLEISPIQGLGVTGVFSNADKAANLAGKKFYEDLEADPRKFKFKIGNYITKDWSETANPSFYASSEGSIIWSNLLTGLWDGKFTSAGSTSLPINAKVDLKATAKGNVTGINEWPKGAAKPNKEIIKNGKITQKTISVTGTKPSSPPETLSDTPVKGITIDFDWESGSSSGKGKWESVDEQTLAGTWGIGSSSVNGGTWQLKKA
jgi:hypothetical protein